MAVLETVQLVFDLRNMDPSAIFCSGYMLPMVGPADTGKSACIMSILSALTSLSTVGQQV